MRFNRTLICVIVMCAIWATTAMAHSPNERRHAVTLWWIIFNSPENCVTNPGSVERCGLVDVMGQPYLDSVAAGQPDPSLISPNLASGLAAVYASGGISRKSGYLRLTASLYRTAAEGLNLGGNHIVDPLGLGRAFSNPNAEVHLVLRDHGKRNRHDWVTQITSYLDPYCSDPLLAYEGGDNVCVDIQFAVFAPGESGKDSVFAAADGRFLHNSTAYLFRQGDMLQAVVETNVRHR